MSNELQKEDFLLPGNLGNATIIGTGQNRAITKIQKNNKDGSVTITIRQVVDHYLNGIPVTEDAEFEVVKQKQIGNASE